MVLSNLQTLKSIVNSDYSDLDSQIRDDLENLDIWVKYQNLLYCFSIINHFSIPLYFLILLILMLYYPLFIILDRYGSPL